MVRYFLHKMYLFIAVTSECVSPSVMWPHGRCSSPGSPVHGIFQARVLESVAISSSRGSSWPRDWIPTFCISGRFCTIWATAVAQVRPFLLDWCQPLSSGTPATAVASSLVSLLLPTLYQSSSSCPPPPRLQPVLSPPIPQSPREAGGGTTLASLPAAQLRGKAPESSRLSGLLLPFPLSIRAVLGSVLPLEPFRHILASWPLPFLAPTLLDMCILRLAPSLTFVASVGRSPSQWGDLTTRM